MSHHLLPKYLASESKHLRLLKDEAAPVQWPGQEHNHAALSLASEGDYPYWYMDETLCGIPVPQFDLAQFQAEARAGVPHTQPVCAGDTDCPACLEALGL